MAASRWCRRCVPVMALGLAVLGGACGAGRHDLEVVNAWDRGITLSLVTEHAGLPDQAAPLGSVRQRAVARFPAVLATGDDRFRFCYGYQVHMVAEDVDLCVTRQALQQAGWRLTIPTTPYSCR